MEQQYKTNKQTNRKAKRMEQQYKTNKQTEWKNNETVDAS
jgi:hypothetical protein